MSDVAIHVAIGLLGSALVAATLIVLVHRRAARRMRRAMQAASPMSTAGKSVASADKEQLRAQTTAAMRRLELNVAQLKRHLKTHSIDIDQVNGVLWQPRTASVIRENIQPAAVLQRNAASKQQASPFSELLSFASRNRAARRASGHQAEIGKLRAELSDKCRLLDERESTINRLRDELNVVRDIDAELRCTNIANRRRNVAIEKKLRREISDLHAQLLQAARAHARPQRDR